MPYSLSGKDLLHVERKFISESYSSMSWSSARSAPATPALRTAMLHSPS